MFVFKCFLKITASISHFYSQIAVLCYKMKIYCKKQMELTPIIAVSYMRNNSQ